MAYHKYMKGLKGNETKSDYLYELGYLALGMSEFDKAIEYFESSLEYDNYTVSYYKTYLNYWLGHIWEQKGDLEMAHKYYLKHGDIYYIRMIQAKIHEQAGEIACAEQEYLRASKVQLFEEYAYEPFLLLSKMFLSLENFDYALYYADIYICFREIERSDAMHAFDIPVIENEEEKQLVEEIYKKRKEKLGY